MCRGQGERGSKDGVGDAGRDYTRDGASGQSGGARKVVAAIVIVNSNNCTYCYAVVVIVILSYQ